MLCCFMVGELGEEAAAATAVFGVVGVLEVPLKRVALLGDEAICDCLVEDAEVGVLVNNDWRPLAVPGVPTPPFVPGVVGAERGGILLPLPGDWLV